MWEKARVGWFEKTALKHEYYYVWNRSPVQVWCMKQGTQSRCTGTTLRDGMGREEGGGFRTADTCTPMAGSCQFSSVQFSSVQLLSHVRLFEKPKNCSMPGFPVHHQLPEFTQTHVHQVSDAIQPCHPLSSPSPPALNLSQHQGLFKWVRSSVPVNVWQKSL